MKHGELNITPEEELQAIASGDPALANVYADMTAWTEAHPCACEAGCDCEEDPIIPGYGSSKED